MTDGREIKIVKEDSFIIHSAQITKYRFHGNPALFAVQAMFPNSPYRVLAVFRYLLGSNATFFIFHYHNLLDEA